MWSSKSKSMLQHVCTTMNKTGEGMQPYFTKDATVKYVIGEIDKVLRNAIAYHHTPL